MSLRYAYQKGSPLIVGDENTSDTILPMNGNSSLERTLTKAAESSGDKWRTVSRLFAAAAGGGKKKPTIMSGKNMETSDEDRRRRSRRAAEKAENVMHLICWGPK